MDQPNGVLWRIQELERRMGSLDEHGSRQVGVIKEQLRAQRGDIAELKHKLESNTRALWGIAVVLLVGTVGIIATLVTAGGGGG